MSPAGPIAPLDILYGLCTAMAAGNLYMAHRCGFTMRVLMGTLQAAGFQGVAGKQRTQAFDLWALATKSTMEDSRLREMAGIYLPE